MLVSFGGFGVIWLFDVFTFIGKAKAFEEQWDLDFIECMWGAKAFA